MFARSRTLVLAIAAVVVIAACEPAASTTPVPSAGAGKSIDPGATLVAPSVSPAGEARVILLGRIVTMAEPAVAEAIAFEDGRVIAVGARDEVMALADEQTQVIELGDNVVYPGFIDAHSHWIGDREHYGGDPPRTPCRRRSAAAGPRSGSSG